MRSEVHRRAIVTAMLRAEKAERARIATELHDDTVQVMTASLISLDRVLKAEMADAQLREKLNDARATIAEAAERTRRLSFELRPAVLHEQGLTPPITSMAQQSGREIAPRCSSTCPAAGSSGRSRSSSTAPSRRPSRTFASTRGRSMCRSRSPDGGLR